MMGALSNSVREKTLILRSTELLAESGQYVQQGTKIVHVGAANTVDDSAKGLAHGDRVMALGVAKMVANDRPLTISKNPNDAVDEFTRRNPPVGTIAYRLKAYEESIARDPDSWDERSNWDLAHGNKHDYKY